MANYYGAPVTTLIEAFGRLPGVGQKSAQRLAFYILHQPEEVAQQLATAIIEAKQKTTYCTVCCNLTEQPTCAVCQNPRRDKHTILVVESPKDMAAYERTGEYFGLYHVLHGAISPMNGIGPNDLRIKELLQRLHQPAETQVTEIIVATNPNVEGEATALYLSKLLKPLALKVSRIAHGVPIGGDLEHVDEVTLLRALQWRREL